MPRPRPVNVPKSPTNGPLSQKNPDDLGNVCAERFHNSDLAAFLNGNGDERAHDSERGYDDDEKEEKEHDVALEAHRFEELMIHFGPGWANTGGSRNCSMILSHDPRRRGRQFRTVMPCNASPRL